MTKVIVLQPLNNNYDNLLMVEMRGVEPLSESIAVQLSTSVSLIFYFAASSPKGGLISRYLDKFPLVSPRIETKVSCK